MKYKLILFFICIASLQNMQAQETKSLTLKDAIELSLKNSKKLKLNQAKILQATNNIKEAEDRKLPNAGASATYMFLPINPNISLKTTSSNSGGSASGGGFPSVHQAMLASVSGSWGLYDGGKNNCAIQSAKYLEQAVKLDAENDKDAIVLNSITAGINLFVAYETIDLVKENLLQSQQRVKDYGNLEKNGLLARNDLLKAELQQSNIELSLLDAQSNYKLSCTNMNIMMGLPEQTILVPDKSGLLLPANIKTIDEYEQIALQNRKELNSIGFRKKAAELDIKSTMANKYPTIALTGGYIAADIPKFISITNAINFGVGIKYNIASLWKNKTKITTAEIVASQIAVNQDMLNDNIRLQINQAYQNYIVSAKKIEVHQKSVTQATENYRITKNKNDNALATTQELIDADSALLQAKLSVTDAQAFAFLAYKKLQYACGIINLNN